MRYPDATQYMHLAKEINSGVFFGKDFDIYEGFIKSRRVPPLYPFMLAPFAGGKFNLAHVAISISLLMSMLTFIPLYMVTGLVFSRRTALIAAAVLTFNSFTLWYSSCILTEATFSALYICVIAVSVYALTRPSFKLFILAGVLSSLLFLTRDVGFTAVWMIAAGAFIKFRFLDKIRRRRVIALSAAMITAFFAVSMPYFIHNRVRTGEWRLSVRMHNKSIARQVQLYGGGRFDRDRQMGKHRGVALLGDKEAKKASDFLKIAPKLSAKLVMNTISYGSAMIIRLGPFLFLFLLIGLVATIREYIQNKDAERLFMAFWVVVWILQFLGVYALITPHMRDDRYIYPLMIPGIMLAAHGLYTASDWLGVKMTETGNVKTTTTSAKILLPLLAAVAYIAILPCFLDPYSLKTFGNLYPIHPKLFDLFPLTGASVVFFMAAVPAVRLLSETFIENRSSTIKAVIASFMLIISGIFVLVLWGGTALNEAIRTKGQPYISVDFVGALLVGVGFALIFKVGLRKGFLAGRSQWLFSVLLIVLVFFSQMHDYMYMRSLWAPERIYTLSSSGHKPAAEEIKALGLVPAGKIVWARKPFIVYHLDGNAYNPHYGRDLIPIKVHEMIKLIASGAVDYVVADSNNLGFYRPRLAGLSFALYPLPGARLIYSRFFPEYRKVISVYKCGQEEVPLRNLGSARIHISRAREFMRKGALAFAYKELGMAAKIEPENRNAWFLMRNILWIYYQCLRQTRFPTMLHAPRVLPLLVGTSRNCVKLSPNDPNALSFQTDVADIYRRELELINKLKK